MDARLEYVVGKLRSVLADLRKVSTEEPGSAARFDSPVARALKAGADAIAHCNDFLDRNPPADTSEEATQARKREWEENAVPLIRELEVERNRLKEARLKAAKEVSS